MVRSVDIYVSLGPEDPRNEYNWELEIFLDIGAQEADLWVNGNLEGTFAWDCERACFRELLPFDYEDPKGETYNAAYYQDLLESEVRYQISHSLCVAAE